ncbi:MAG: lamin tail domain-containing protein, partial [Anaerolineales bacterium]|nr:lamin tail domain-containing protein [Anaerolineales bacterium]
MPDSPPVIFLRLYPDLMQHLKRLPRALLFITLLTGLLGGMIAPTLVDESVNAAPMRQAAALDVIISEVAWSGTSSSYTSDEWIELYNTTSSDIPLSGWTLSDGG